MANQLTPSNRCPSLLALLNELIDREHERAKLLAAYRLRHRWKASDAARLRQLKLSPVAERRVSQLNGRGRPIVTHATPLSNFLQKALHSMKALDEKASPGDRLAAIKKMHWWPHYVEAVYRGEYKAAKAGGLGSAAETTEELIAKNLGISSAVVRKLCTKIRKMRGEDFDAANFPPARLCDFIDWIRSGKREKFLPL